LAILIRPEQDGRKPTQTQKWTCLLSAL
jgi:hypothetical protein